MGTDRDLPVGDWIHYSLTGSGSHLFSPDNVTNRVHVVGDLVLPPGELNERYTFVSGIIQKSSHK